MLFVRPSVLVDAEIIAPNLRKADLQEIQALVGSDTPTGQVLASCIQSSSTAKTVISSEGEPLALFGVSGIGEYGAVWMVATDQLTAPHNRRQFIRECRHWVSILGHGYQALGNVVDVRNYQHIRWIRWCGFTTIHTWPHYGAEQQPFLEFYKLCV